MKMGCPWRLMGGSLLVLLGVSLAWGAEKPRSGVPADAPRLDFEPRFVSKAFVRVDGGIDEWEGVAEVAVTTLTAGEYEYDWSGPRDLSAKVRVQYSEEAFFVLVQVRDNVVTGPKKKWGGDKVDLWFDTGELALVKGGPVMLSVDPSPLAEGRKPTAQWGEPAAWRKRSLGEVAVAGFRTEDGYDLEVKVPFAEIAKASPLMESMGFCVVVRDWDHDDPNEAEAAVSSCPLDFRRNKKRKTEDLGRVKWQMREAIWAGVLKTYPELAEAPQLRAQGNVGGDESREEVVVVGGKLIVMGLGLGPGAWFFSALPFGEAHKVTELLLQDVTHDGFADIIVVSRGPCGTHDAWEVEHWTLFGFDEGLTEALAIFERGRFSTQSDARVVNTLSFAKGKLSIKPEAQGVDASSLPSCMPLDSEVLQPLVLPWEKGRSRVLTYEDGAFQ